MKPHIELIKVPFIINQVLDIQHCVKVLRHPLISLYSLGKWEINAVKRANVDGNTVYEAKTELVQLK